MTTYIELGWAARLCHTWLVQSGKATCIYHGENLKSIQNAKRKEEKRYKEKNTHAFFWGANISSSYYHKQMFKKVFS